jgi:Tfp pilus assembly protein FimT
MRTSGATIAELAVAVAVLALAAAVSLPTLAEARARGAVAAATRWLVAALHAQRWRAVALGETHGLYFVREGGGWQWYEVRDGNGNGLRAREIADGTDPTLAGPHRLETAAPGVGPGFPPTGPFPEIPPAGGPIDLTADPIRFGSSDIVSFGPLGTASSGRIYLTDGRAELQAVVLYGQTGRARVWRYEAEAARWRQ